MPDSDATRPPSPFGPTRWTLVLAAAGQNDSPAHRAALAELCETYWYPLYAYIRRCGYGRHDAEDLTQGFFARVLEKNYLADASPERGRFRSFLLASLKHYMANEWDRSQALKRGGGLIMVSLDVTTAESRHPWEPSDGVTPDQMYERQWVFALLDRVLGRLEGEYREKPELFAALKGFLTSETIPGALAQAARCLHLTEGAARVAVHRLRRRYRELLRAEIAQTVDEPSEIDAEIRRLFSVFSQTS